MRILLIDDMRDIDSQVRKYLNVESWTGVVERTYDSGISALKELGPWDILFLDHDLASFDEGGREKTGYDVICFLEANSEFLPKKIIIVSANPVGRQKMQTVIDRLYRRE